MADNRQITKCYAYETEWCPVTEADAQRTLSKSFANVALVMDALRQGQTIHTAWAMYRMALETAAEGGKET